MPEHVRIFFRRLLRPFKVLRIQLKKPLLAKILAPALVLLTMACGPTPPQDPFNLASAKDSLNKGHHWYLRGCHREAIRFFDEGLAYARLSDAAPLIVMAHNSLGTALLAQGNLKAAAEKLAEALDLTLTLPERPELDSILGNLGSLAFKAQRNADAESFWAKALEAAAEPRKAIYLANLARLYKAENRTAEFEDAANMALTASANPLTPTPARADALSLSAEIALSRGDTDLAEGFLTEALSLDRKTENVVGLAQNLELTGRIFLAKDKIPEAAQSFDRSFYLYVALKDKGGAARLLKLMAQTHEKGHPPNLTPYKNVLKNPSAFDPIDGLCP